MPNYQVTFRRHVTLVDEFTRVITADNENDAQAKAEDMAQRSNHDCPDDCDETGDVDLGSFYIESLDETDAEADDDA